MLKSRASDAIMWAFSHLKSVEKKETEKLWIRQCSETASSYFTRAHFSDSDPSEGLNTWMITILLLLLLLQLSGRKTCLALAVAAHPQPLPFVPDWNAYI